MTKEEAVERVKELEKEALPQEFGCNDEACHEMEDSLRRDFIEAVAQGEDSLAEVAKEVLKTSEIHFHRWYA